MPGLHAGAEIEGVGIVQTHFGERSGSGVQERMITVIIKRQMRAGGDTAGQVLQAFEQIGFGLDKRGLANQSLGFGDGVLQGLRIRHLSHWPFPARA